MPVDPSIIAGLRPVEIQQADPIEQYGKNLTLRNLMQKGDLEALQVQNAKRGLDDETAIRDAYTQAGGDAGRLRTLLQSGGQYKQIQALDKLDLENKAKNATISKDNSAAEKAKFEVDMGRLQHGGALLDGVTDQASWEAAKRIGQITGTFAPEAIAHFPQEYNPQYIASLKNAAVTRAQMLESQNRDRTAVETNRHNTATETNAAGTLRVAQGNLGVNQSRLKMEQDAPKGVLQQTNDGTFLVDPRQATAQPVIGPDGKQLSGKPMKDIPASVLTGMMENNRSLNKVNQALAAVSGNQDGLPSGVQADPNAVGFKGYLPNVVLNRVDPKGTDTRALISDIGSLKIHDRSGAAVTASEAPRLMPFIPLGTDNAETVAKKLGNFKREYELMQQETGNYYSPDNGFKPYKAAVAPTAVKAPIATRVDSLSQADPAQYSGMIASGDDGVRYKSDGKKWVRQ